MNKYFCANKKEHTVFMLLVCSRKIQNEKMIVFNFWRNPELEQDFTVTIRLKGRD